MIELQEKIVAMSDVFTRRLVHEDDAIKVYIVNHAQPGDPVLGAELDEQVPATKCYLSQGLKTREWNEKWKSIIPYGMLYIKGTDYFYDFGPQSHMMHDTNFADKFNASVTAIDIRQAHPDIAYFFDLDVLQSIFCQMPVLGVHFDLDHLRSAYLNTLFEFQQQVEQAFSSAELNVKTHCFYNDFCILSNRNTNEGLHVILAQVLNDELSVNLGILLNDMKMGLTVETMENQTKRSRVIKDVVDSWLLSSEFNRISKKILKQDHELCISLLRQHLVRFFQSKLSQAIYQVIEK